MDRKGMYEFILTKSVMLIFILGLVGIFYSLYNTLNMDSAEDIADSEASRLAKQIDDIIGFKGVGNTATVNLKRYLMVGKESVPYSLTVQQNGQMIIRLERYPYDNITGINRFGLALTKSTKVPSSDSITCTWSDIENGASIIVTKTNEYSYSTKDEKFYYTVTVKLDASESCHEQMVFEQTFEEN